MEHESRTRLATALVLAAVFGTGVLLGLAADSSLNATPPEVVVEAPEADGSDEREEPRRRRRVYEEVDPTEAQLAQIDEIIKEHRSRTNALDHDLRAEYSAGFRVILLETREAIKGVFTQEQAAEYQRLLDERDARAAAERENREGRD